MPKYESAGEIIIEEKKVDPGEKYRPEKPTGPETSVEELAGKITRVSVGQELKKSIESRYEEIRSMDPEELIPIYHGCRGGFNEAISNVLSYQGGVRQFKYYHASRGDNNATFSLIPVSVYWNGIDRGGIKMYVPRKELALPGESYDGKRVVLVEPPEGNDGKPVVNSGVGVVGIVGGSTDSYLSLLDLEGEIAVGEYTKVDKESAEKIIELNEKFAAIREHLKNPREKLTAILNETLRETKDLPEADKLLQDRKYEVLTMPLVANRALDQTISLTAEAFKKDLEKLKHKKEQELETGQAEVNKVQSNVEKLSDDLKAYQENQGLWAKISGKESKALEQLEETYAGVIKEFPAILEGEADLGENEELAGKTRILIGLLGERNLSLKDKNQKLKLELNKFAGLANLFERFQKENEVFIAAYQEAVKSKG